jgi:SHS2 domain-containing protein
MRPQKKWKRSIMTKAFEFLEHTADVYVAAHGATLEESFENAALALFETMTNTKTVRVDAADEYEVKGDDESALLYAWLETLIVNFDVEEKLYSRFKIEKIEKTRKGYSLRAWAWGEPFDPERHPSRVGVKAITYHLMEIVRENGMVTVKFILDI